MKTRDVPRCILLPEDEGGYDTTNTPNTHDNTRGYGSLAMRNDVIRGLYHAYLIADLQLHRNSHTYAKIPAMHPEVPARLRNKPVGYAVNWDALDK